MPLMQGRSKKAVSENIKSEMEAGMPQKQSIAVALSVQRKNKRKKMADGGKVESPMPMHKDEQMSDEDRHADSIAMAIMARRKAKKMADGGMVDLSENAEEEPNNLDDMNFEALKKENYSEEAGLSALSEPEDSNEHAMEPKNEDEHDMVDDFRKDIHFEEREADDMIESIRRKIKAKRGF